MTGIRKKSLTSDILKVVAKSRTGLTAWQTIKEMDYEDPQTIRITLSSLVHKGYLRVVDKTECPSCSREHVNYRITEQGRIRLNRCNSP